MKNATRDRMLTLLPELSDMDRTIIESTSYGTSRGVGMCPALLLIDFQGAYLGEDAPLDKQIARNPTAGGEHAWAALRCSLPVLAAARASQVSVVLTRIAYAQGSEHDNTFAAKRGAASLFIDGTTGTLLAAELGAQEDDIVIRKHSASAFHGTGLHQQLRNRGVDTVLVAGLSTSGCVRATVVDAASYGYRVAVIEDGTADRIDLSRRIALLDMWMKYADVVQAELSHEYVKKFQKGPA